MAKKLSVTINGKEYVSPEAKKAGNSLKDLGKTSDKVNKAMKVAFAAAAAGILASVVAMTKAVSSATKLADNIDKMSQKIGISRQAFQEWDFILSQNGMTISTLQTGVKTLASAAEEASRGVITYTRTFDALGVSVKKTDGTLKDQETLLFESIKALSEIENTTLRTALATDLFGRSATELAPLLNSGAEGVENLRKKAHDLGLVLGDETVNAGRDLTDTIDQLKRTFKAAIANAVTPMMAEVNNLVQMFLQSTQEGGGLNKFVGVMVRWVAWSVAQVPKVAAVFEFVGDVIGITAKYAKIEIDKMLGSIDTFLTDIGVMGVIENVINFVIKIGGDTYDAIKKGLDTGDWADFWDVGAEALRTGVKIGLTLIGVAKAASAALGLIRAAFGFTVSGSLVAGAALGILSIFLALKQAGQDGDYMKVAQDMAAAIGLGLLAGGLTASPVVGVWVATLAFNFELGSKSIGKFVDDTLDAMAGGEAKTIFGKAFDVGKELGENLRNGFNSVKGWFSAGEDFANEVKTGATRSFEIKSPSVWAKEELAGNIIKGFVNGIEGYTGEVLAKWELLMEKLQAMSTIDVKAEIKRIISGEDGGGEDKKGGSLSILFSGISESIQALASFKAILDPITTILGGVMEVLSPVINEVLDPLVGILKILGQTLGAILVPVIKILVPVIEVVAKAFVWLYNNAILPFANFMIEAFNMIRGGVAQFLNILVMIYNALFGWMFGYLNHVAVPGKDEGKLSPIDIGDLSSGTSSFAGGGVGSSTSIQSLTINVITNVDGNIIGAGGLEQVGEYFVRAIQAYAGAGGNVTIEGVA